MSDCFKCDALISAIAGLVGAIIGALATARSAKSSFDQQRKAQHEDSNRQAESELRGIQLLIDVATEQSHCTDAARALRKYFFRHPDQLYLSEANQQFFGNHLADISDPPWGHPSGEHWTGENNRRMRALKQDAKTLEFLPPVAK